MLLAAIITERSLYLLCLCARLTGATSYGEVGEAAFGPWMETFISFVLGIFLIFVIIAYMVLAQDIWTSVLKIAFAMEANKDVVLLVIVIMITPFLMQETLHALRFNCYVGFSSVTVLCMALVHHAWKTKTSAPSDESPDTTDHLLWWTSDWEDVLVAFPIITLSFLSIFNVLPIQNALLRPTRIRVLLTIDGAMSSCFVLTVIFGVAGYIFSSSQTDGNILNNCHAESDIFLFLGQLGCGVTVVLAMPMMLLPCRASLLEVLDVLVNGPHKTPVEKEAEEESQTLLKEKENIPVYEATHPEESVSSVERSKVPITDKTLVHYTSTLLIVLTCFVISINVPGVATVWSIIGCFMAYLFSFILPSVCYLEIQQRYPNHSLQCTSWVWFSWILLVGSVVAGTACTAETIKRLILQ
ncbi:transmembrane amino acid transporter [Nitzschia inconspicua]|uniref:Transmembrane amino acid transporter n=1 Tax=Nitzschia inconspicua TaxID=303405 RepID=A0A9K3P927_9STRA|nr:transmembrane amino acid transporter [Nitzschia inconspicua]KAG7360792.1 transmembrane amino acid transporter [Nitzschia inconspicua]